MSWPITKSDVYVKPTLRDTCEDCDQTVTREVYLFIRSIGTSVHVGSFCEEHANAQAERIRDGLPEDGED